MARGRMLDQRFVQSEKLRAVSRDARLAYACILPFLDRDGRTNAEPIVLKANVFRRTDFELDEIPLVLAELHKAGLITLYADEDNEAILEFSGFLSFNSPNKKERESDFPGPADPNASEVREHSITNALSLHVQSSAEPETASQSASRHGTTGARAKPVQSTGTASARHVLNVNVNDNGERELNPLSVSGAEPPATAPPAAEPRSHLQLDDLIRIWNRERGQLVQCRSNKDPQLRRLGKAFLERHKKTPDGGEELFRAGITSVRSDPHWLGRRAPKVTRDGDPYGIVNYLRHAESKADAALDAEDNPRPTNPLLAQYEHLRGGTGGGS